MTHSKIATVRNFCRNETFETVNDKHSELNSTVVAKISKPRNACEIRAVLKSAQSSGQRISIAGGRHAMGGQQFLRHAHLLDMSLIDSIVSFDKELGLLKVEAGIQWPAIIDFLQQGQPCEHTPWTIAQKQTGCDNLSIGGALSANIHGRGLTKAPFIRDIENFEVMMHDGQIKHCDRKQNSRLFSLAIGGYGLFGVILTVTLRLVRQGFLQRKVELIESENAIERMTARAKEGATYGDFQFSIDDRSEAFLKEGILSTYIPTAIKPANNDYQSLSADNWHELLRLAHSNKKLAFEKYVKHYLATNAQIYSSNTMQLSTYIDGYHHTVDLDSSNHKKGSEMITELYVPREMLAEFLKRCAVMLRQYSANVVYGTVRLIEQDNESFLAWANQPWACIIFNLHVEHTETGIAQSSETFRQLIQLAIAFGGTYYLTYHRFATREQILQCHPRLPQFFEWKTKYDPFNTFGSDWYDHTLRLLSGS